MDGFINKIFNSVSDESVHLQFQKFSKGTFNDRALIRATKSAKGFSVTTGPEYANELVRAAAGKLGDTKTRVTGPIITTLKLKDLPAFHKLLAHITLKQFAGVRQHILDVELSGNEILEYMGKAPDAFFALSFTAGDTVLKIKAKAPKSAKPSTSEKPAKADFCSFKTSDAALVKSFIIEDGWKTFEANHSYVITEIIMPQGVTDPAEIRRLAKRKGKLVRKRIIDGKESVVEKEFTA